MAQSLPESASSRSSNLHSGDDEFDGSPTVSENNVSGTSTSAAEPRLIPYPAPLPKFSPATVDVLNSAVKSKVMLVYGEIIKESMAFYANMILSNTAQAKVSIANIVRTMIEHYPVLVVSDRNSSWSYFNGKLSSYLRYFRNWVKNKLNTKHPVKLIKLVQTPHLVLDPTDYDNHIDEIKTATTKRTPNISHLTQLVQATFAQRRKWIDESPLQELTMKAIFDKFPCFKLEEMRHLEVKMLHGEEKVLKFAGE